MQGQSTDDIATLKAEHSRLDQRIRELEHHLSLSPEEQRECSDLKKTKLQLKDRLLHLERAR